MKIAETGPTGRKRLSKEDYPSIHASGPLHVVKLPGKRGQKRYSITHATTGYAVAFFSRQKDALETAVCLDTLVEDRSAWESKSAKRVSSAVHRNLQHWISDCRRKDRFLKPSGERSFTEDSADEDTREIAPGLTFGEILSAAERQMTDLENPGFCLECGAENTADPDSRNIRCECCGAHRVFGASELVQMYA